ncbi:hypothetical protein F444_22095 [Phytophthora nicotianae P1976]|uniref:Uncharacterized protein n=1 Tax=Phytophthora nicotianae P1976 TaxID=1317066 RepID=A0A080YYW2_PHYNI|nr:hypothetical protein F444_22095 [Phytophthora nicotianae P1976]
MIKTNETEMWKYLEIILFNKLQTAKCKPEWDVRQHVNGMFLVKAQLAALNADVQEPIFTNMLMRSLPANARGAVLRSSSRSSATQSEHISRRRSC